MNSCKNITKENEDQSDDETHHKKGGDHADVGQDCRHLPSLIIVIFHTKRGIIIQPGIRLNWTPRTTVTPCFWWVKMFPIFSEFCRTPGLKIFLIFLQYVFHFKYFYLLPLAGSQLRNVYHDIYHVRRQNTWREIHRAYQGRGH